MSAGEEVAVGFSGGGYLCFFFLGRGLLHH